MADRRNQSLEKLGNDTYPKWSISEIMSGLQMAYLA